MSVNIYRKQTLLFSLLVCSVIIFSTFYSQLSPGGEGLAIPYNSLVWISATFVICAAIFQVLIKREITVPKYWLAIAALPLGIIISGFIVQPSKPIEWLIRIGFVSGGYLFFIALFQFKFNRYVIENILYGICFSAVLHSVITLHQISNWSIFTFIPNTVNNAPISMFQQININASYLTTSFFIALYLASSASLKHRSILLKALLIITIFSTTAILLAISSRTTLVAFAVSLPLIAFARYKSFKKHKQFILIIIAAFILGLSSGAYLSKGFAKYETKLDTQRQHARTYIYDLSWQLFKKEPVFGHGLGQFEKVFQEAKIDYPHSNKMGGQRFSHPHNEFLFWMIESGSLSIIGILIAILFTLKLLYTLGLNTSLTYIALLFPISFHTQVELPFYLSSALWFLWITLLFLIHQHKQKTCAIKLSFASYKLATVSVILSSILIVTFLIHSLVSLSGVVHFMRQKNANFAHLNAAENNIYFQSFAHNISFTQLLYHDIATGKQELTALFIQWAEPFIQQSPAPDVISNLAMAYWYLEQKDKARVLIEKANKMYPTTHSIQQRYEDIKSNKPIGEFKQRVRIAAEHIPSQAKVVNKNK